MPASYKERLIVFTRYPRPGTTKTRLIPELGEKGAADLHRKMTENTLTQVKKLPTSRDLTIEIRYEDGNEKLMKNWLGTGFDYRPQYSGDLGLRMKRSFEDAFTAGANTAVLIGTDIPNITHEIILKAFDVLKQKKIVLGPAKDGGYYLIGLQRYSQPSAISYLFENISWGADDVLDKTLNVAKHAELSLKLLEVLEDVDNPEDLKIWDQLQNKRNGYSGLISIIIPALNEADNIAKTLTNIGPSNKREIIVVDGGSRDSTASMARSFGAKVITSLPPKARQMNRGAEIATGDVLLFLHADTLLPKNFDEYILESLSRPGTVAGAFELSVDSPIPALRFIERLANWRSRRLRLPYGDKAIFVQSKLFHEVGGFPHIPIMEDFQLMRCLRKEGEIATLPVSVSTSPRRWEKSGILKTTLINQLIIVAYFTGIAPDVIARWYRRSYNIKQKRR
jgi:rSAM/selenodomain-associated transferase 2/rSAM/selenodomain-associated transferase 1